MYKISLVTFNHRVLRLPTKIEFSRRNRHGNRPLLIGLKSRNLLNYVILNQYSGFSAAKQTKWKSNLFLLANFDFLHGETAMFFTACLKSRNLLNYVILNQYSGFSAAKQTCQVEIRFYSCWRTSIFFLFFTW